MSDLNRLRELAALLQPKPVTEARVKTRADLEKKFKSVEDTVKDLADDLSTGGTIEAMMDDVGVSSHKDAAAMLKTLNSAVKTIQSTMMEVEGLLFSAMTESLTEMAAIRDFSSGWTKSRQAKELVAAFKAGEETVDLKDGSKFKAVKSVSGAQIAKGMVVLASYNSHNQGAELYAILGVSDDGAEDTVKYDSVAEAMKAHGVKNLKDLEEKDCHLVVRDLNDGDEGGFFYLYKGAWARGSGAERLSFTLVEKVGGPTNEAKNHMEENTYQSVASWKRALKAKHGDKVWYQPHEGTNDAFIGPKPFKKGETKQVGDWDDTTGTVY